MTLLLTTDTNQLIITSYIQLYNVSESMKLVWLLTLLLTIETNAFTKIVTNLLTKYVTNH